MRSINWRSSSRVGGVFEIFDDVRLDPGVADESDGVARGPAIRIVVDDHIHDHAAPFEVRMPFALADLAQLRLQGRLVERADGKCGEGRDPVPEIAKGRDERPLLLDFAAFDGGRILDAPVGRHRLAGQNGQVSPAALSQTVNTKSITGAPGSANSPQLFERRSSVGNSASLSTLRASG